MKPLCQSLALCESFAGSLGLSEVRGMHAEKEGRCVQKRELLGQTVKAKWK